MSALITVFAEIAFLILLGFLLRKKRVIDERGQQCLTGILMSAVLPFSILSSSQQEYSLVFLKAVLAVAGAALHPRGGVLRHPCGCGRGSRKCYPTRIPTWRYRSGVRVCRGVRGPCRAGGRRPWCWVRW